MAIRKTYGIEAAAKAGKLIGEIQAGEKEQARKERLADKAAAYANQRAMAKFNAQMQFERFRMSAIMDLQSEQRARAWEVEKMQRRSELDFAADERQRAKRIQEFQSGISEIEKAEQLNQYPQYVLDQAKSDLASKYYDIPQAAPYLGLKNLPEATPTVKRTDVDSAIEFLQGYEEKKQKAESWRHPLSPEPTPEEEQAAAYYKDILNQTETTTIENPVLKEPQNIQEFENIVAQLKRINVNQAKMYYNQWASKF